MHIYVLEQQLGISPWHDHAQKHNSGGNLSVVSCVKRLVIMITSENAADGLICQNTQSLAQPAHNLRCELILRGISSFVRNLLLGLGTK